MTTVERINLRRSAAELRHWLIAQGCTVLDSKLVGRTPVLAVSGPVPSELTNQVMVLTEKLGGLERRAWLARLGGCCIHWREN
jgi:hypothetical protein